MWECASNFLCSLKVLILCSTQFHLEDSTSFHLKNNTLLPILVINQTQIRVATNALCYYKKTLSLIRCSHKYYSKIWLTQLISLFLGDGRLKITWQWKLKHCVTMVHLCVLSRSGYNITWHWWSRPHQYLLKSLLIEGMFLKVVAHVPRNVRSCHWLAY